MTAESTFAHSFGRDARMLMRRAQWASLATFDRQTSFPYVSLIAVATDVSGDPLFLISTLARHTQNLEFDARASILFSAVGSVLDPLDAPRVSVMGRACVTRDETARLRFLARHGETMGYASFSDFALWTLAPELGHYVGGFGRIHTLPASDLRLVCDASAAIAAAHPEALANLNARPALVEALATARLGAKPGAWTFAGFDPEGCDLVLAGESLRLDFGSPLQSPAELPVLLEKLATSA